VPHGIGEGRHTARKGIYRFEDLETPRPGALRRAPVERGASGPESRGDDEAERLVALAALLPVGVPGVARDERPELPEEALHGLAHGRASPSALSKERDANRLCTIFRASSFGVTSGA
jgi:hypothetical protein